MDNLLPSRSRILFLCAERLEDIRVKGLGVWGPALGASDMILEDALVLSEIMDRLTEAEWRNFIIGELKEIHQNGNPDRC